MTRRLTLFFVACLVAAVSGLAQSGDEILNKSIKFHDPDNLWQTGHFMFDLKETRPGAEDRNSMIEIDNQKGSFSAIRNTNGKMIEFGVKEGDCYQAIDFSSQITEEEIEELGLTCERSKTLRDYYTYIWGLPMKLKDSGTIVGEVTEVEFNGSNVLSVRVTYSEEVGSDIWYFYFEPETYRMVGYRFYHDEEKNDGEYIFLGEPINVGTMKIPTNRKWYYNSDDKFLGEDILENARIYQ